MRDLTISKYSILLIIILLGVFSSCKPKIRPLKAGKKTVVNFTFKPIDEARIKKEIHYDLKRFRVDSVMERKVHHEGFNGAVLVAQKGVIIYDSVFGYSNFRTHLPLSGHSAFQLASVSKTITGTAILQLTEAGKISLDDSVQKFFPKFPYHKIFIKDLLSHRSGLPNYLYAYDVNRKHHLPTPSNKDILEWFDTVNPTPPPYRQPGTRFGYCNTNFALLASIIEKVSGMSFHDYLTKAIFNPLGMKDTFIDTLGSTEQLANRTVGHKGTGVLRRDYFDGVYGDKGIYSTTHDLYRFYSALVEHYLISQQSLANAFKPRSFESKSRHNYGLGFRLMTSPENMNHVKYVYHTGWWQGYCTVFWFNPSEDWVIIMLENRKNNSVFAIHPLVEILTGKPYGDEEEIVEE